MERFEDLCKIFFGRFFFFGFFFFFFAFFGFGCSKTLIFEPDSHFSQVNLPVNSDHVNIKIQKDFPISFLSSVFSKTTFFPVFPAGFKVPGYFEFSGNSFDAINALAAACNYSVTPAGRFLYLLPRTADQQQSFLSSSEYVLPLNFYTFPFLSDARFSRVGNSLLYKGDYFVLSSLLNSLQEKHIFQIRILKIISDRSSAADIAAVIEPSELANFFAFDQLGSIADFFLSEVKYIFDFERIKVESINEDLFVVTSGSLFKVSRGVRYPYSTSSVSDGVIVESGVQFIDTSSSYSGCVYPDFLSLIVDENSVDSYSSEGYPIQKKLSFSVDFPFSLGNYSRVYQQKVKYSRGGIFDLISFGFEKGDYILSFYVGVFPIDLKKTKKN